MGSGTKFATCDFVKKIVKDTVNGGVRMEKQEWEYCKILRDTGLGDYIFAYLFGICGPQGRYFLAKDNQKVKK